MIFRYSVWILGGEILSTFIAFYIVEAGVGLVAEEEEEPKNGYPPGTPQFGLRSKDCLLQ